MAYNIGLHGPYDYTGTIENDYFAAAVNFFADRTPLVARLPNRAISGETIRAVDDAFRPGSTTLASNYTASGTTISVADGSPYNDGDVLQIENELMLVTAASGNTLTVTTGFAGTTNANHSSGVTVYLIGNVRTGAEVDVTALTRVPTTTDTTPQTVQHAYQVGGRVQASSANMAIPLGLPTMLGWQRFKALQNVMDDFERSIYYGQYVALAGDATRPMMRGLSQRITTNKVTSPTNASAYKPSDLIRDALQTARVGGGSPDLLLVSSDFMQGLSIWGHAVERITAGATMFGTPIDMLRAPFLGGVTIVEAPLLRTGTVIALTSEEVVMGWKREPNDYPRGRRGDAFEGDVIGEGCVILNNEAHHAWVQGISGFSAS